MIKVTYAGYDITEYLIVTSLDRGILPEIDYNLIKVGRSDGEKFLDRTIGRKTIPMGFYFRYDLIKKRRKLAEILAQKEPKPLIFSDEPDKMWYALPTGDISVGEKDFIGSGKIDWIVPDGVAHDINPRVFSNVSVGVNENQVLDPEFRKKDKYYKLWTGVLNEVYQTHNILSANLSDTNTIADKGETKYNGFYIMQNPLTTSRNLPNLKKGDKVWGRVACRIESPLSGDTNGSKSAVVVIQELDQPGGKVLVSHEVRPSTLAPGTFQQLNVNFTIQNENTKALNMLTCLALGSSVSYSMPQFNLGDSLMAFAEPNTQLAQQIAVTNQGTYKAWPIIRATMNGENGLVGVINQNDGVLQFGNPGDIDTVPGKRTDKVISIPMRNSGAKFELNSLKAKPDYPNFLGNPATPNKQGTGNIDWLKNPEAATPVWSENTEDVWAGPTLYTDIPKNSDNSAVGNFEWKNRFDFEPSKITSGRITFTLQNETKGSVLSAVIRDSSRSKEEFIVEFSCFDKVQKRLTLDRKVWTGRFWEISIKRTGNTSVEWKFSKWKAFSGEGIIAARSEVYSANIPEIANEPIDGMCCWFQKWGNDPTNKYVTYMDWTDTKFYWQNETTITDIPNLFDDGDILEIDVYNRKVTLNGFENNKLHALGNTWERFAVEPGTTTFMPVTSEWADMFDFEVELRGVYI